MKRGCLFFIVLFSCWWCAVVSAKDKLKWLTPNFPPYIILEGQEQQKGIDNRIIQYFMKRLSDYEHISTEMNYLRAYKQIKDQDCVALTPVFKTVEQEKYLLYSEIPSYLAMSNGFAIKKTNHEKFKSFLMIDGSLNLEAVILSNKFKIGISAGRFYGGILDDMIQKYKDTGVFIERGGTDISIGIANMLLADRMDAALGFPVEMEFAVRATGKQGHPVEVLPVFGMVPFVPVHIVVPNNDWGKAVIQKINRTLKADGTIRAFADYYEYWLEDGTRVRYHRLVKEYYSLMLNINMI
jgi:uncharacterized protein (TIGR02285 family)